MRKGIAFTVVLLGIIVYCAPKEEAIVGEQGGALFIGTTEIVTMLSPLETSAFGSNEVLDLLFLRLHRIDPETGKMKPELAASWEFSEDLSSITYYLRDDVLWWDGRPVTAEDVYYTYMMMIDPETHYPDVAQLRFIESVELQGPHTIRFSFSRVYADVLTDSDIMPVPKHLHEQAPGTFGQNPVGNGPYKIEEWVPGSRLVLTANDAYYRGKPPLDEIYVQYYTDAGTMMRDFVDDQLDIVLNITPAAAQQLSADQQIVVDRRPGNTYTYVGWNLAHVYLADREVRQALSLAINTDAVLNEIFGGLGAVSNGPLPPSSWGYNDKIAPLQYDVTRAQEMLRNEGFQDRNQNGVFDKNGRDFVLNIITNSESPDRVALLDAVATDLEELGIRVRTRTLNTEAFIRAIVNKDFDGFIMGWSVSEKIDPTVYWYSDATKGIYNFVSYENKTVDSLIDEGVAMLNRKTAKNIWNEFQKIIYQDLPYTFLVVPDVISASHKRVQGTEHGLALSGAYVYWIPERERREALAAVPPVVEEIVATPSVQPTGEPSEEEGTGGPAVRPEEVLEAAVRRETTTVASLPPDSGIGETPLAPPMPSITTRTTPKNRVTPKYPEAARAIGASGRVVIRVLVGTDGTVKEASILSSFGNPACEAAALDAAKQWEFNPATKDGVPFEQKATIPFDFRP